MRLIKRVDRRIEQDGYNVPKWYGFAFYEDYGFMKVYCLKPFNYLLYWLKGKI